ncbi:13168_t:CDS:1, partial [Acaulospora morrowiae]
NEKNTIPENYTTCLFIFVLSDVRLLRNFSDLNSMKNECTHHRTTDKQPHSFIAFVPRSDSHSVLRMSET